ncbi:uncharacterized protein LOC119436910 isoform X1 [Dermacentor silvarum]|uniref:uncharacterized protein LOC119436910 isoform X1 n=1 Tax=Dermacentor silvarum TaxID=543639 RepID=UPI002100DA27|nr:uncharacterized protein LOC119436910 isoform X1 [Dermacentor silvarum]XP_049516056.1 uncharacterized protein LOC119436910 isoform X1 [Dermacentor silvarum]
MRRLKAAVVSSEEVEVTTVEATAAATVEVSEAGMDKVPEASRVASSKEAQDTARAHQASLEAARLVTFRATTTGRGTAPTQASLRPAQAATEAVLVNSRVDSRVAPRVTSLAMEASTTATLAEAIRRSESSHLVVSLTSPTIMLYSRAFPYIPTKQTRTLKTIQN